MFLTPEKLAAALSFPVQVHVPVANVAENWPLIEGCMADLHMTGERVCIAAAATIRVECPPFKPIIEYGGPRYWTQMYEGRIDLGNIEKGDGARYPGRGLIQITGRKNYRNYGKLIGIDLEASPERALEPNVAAMIFATYFYEHHDLEAANAGNWLKVRKTVNGGTNGLGTFMSAVARLQSALAPVAAAAGGAQ
jgi:hypothetical protein